MSAPSAAFAAVLEKSHRVEHRAYLQVPNGTPNPTHLDTEVLLASWKIGVDGSASVRRKLSAEFADVDPLLPFNAASPIAPFGVEIVIEQRLVGVYETTEWIALGTFGVTEPSIKDTGSMELTITGEDRAARISAARLTADYTVAAGTNVVTAIQALVNSRMVVPWNVLTTTATTPLLVFAEQDDPWQRAQEMAGAAGLELFFDPSGTAVIRQPPDPSVVGAQAAYTFAEGGALVGLSAEFQAKLSYSHAVFIGEGQDKQAPVRADAYDIDPSSPTYWLGPFGDRPVFLKTNIISPDPALAAQQAITAANGLLARKRGAFRTVEISGLPVPSLEPSDLVGVKRDQLSLDDLLVVDSFDLTSDYAGIMGISTRAVRL